MGEGSTGTRRDLPQYYRWIIADAFEEQGSDLLSHTADLRCFYLAQDWHDERHQTYCVALNQEALDFVLELVTYKFGGVDFPTGQWYYFVWSRHKPDRLCSMMREFDGNIQADSRRFWRMTRLMTKNLRDRDDRTED